VKKYLCVPAAKSIPLLIALGYPEDTVPTGKSRSSIDAMYSFGRYGVHG
jgi:hypothetical protein